MESKNKRDNIEEIKNEERENKNKEEKINDKNTNKELLYNIGLKKKNKEKFNEATETFKKINKEYNDYVNGNIKIEEFIETSTNNRIKEIEEGKGLHLDNIIWLFKLKKNEAVNYVKVLKEKIKERREKIENIKEKIMKENINKHFEINYKMNCDNKEYKIKLPLKEEKDKYNYYWAKEINKECKILK